MEEGNLTGMRNEDGRRKLNMRHGMRMEEGNLIGMRNDYGRKKWNRDEE